MNGGRRSENRARRERRGFITLMAMLMLAVMSVAIVAVTTAVRGETQRTQGLSMEAELRQMLGAGAMLAPGLVAMDPPDRRLPDPQPRVARVRLPDELAARGGYVSVRSVPTKLDLEREVTIEATLEGRTASQVLRFLRTRQRWVAVEARIEG